MHPKDAKEKVTSIHHLLSLAQEEEEEFTHFLPRPGRSSRASSAADQTSPSPDDNDDSEENDDNDDNDGDLILGDSELEDESASDPDEDSGVPIYPLRPTGGTTSAAGSVAGASATRPMTTRQAVLASVVDPSHVSLDELGLGKSKKKILNESELALRREETARKRKNLSEKKLEDEKVGGSPIFFFFFPPLCFFLKKPFRQKLSIGSSKSKPAHGAALKK